MTNYSPITYTGDGSTQNYAITWGYIDQDHIAAYVDDVVASFTWVDDGTIRLSSAPAVDAEIRIERVTPGTPLVSFVEGSVDADDLNLATKQAVYRADEAVAGQTGPTGPTGPAGTSGISTVAELQASTALTFPSAFARLRGYYADADYADSLAKGAGDFWYDAADMASTDNGWSVIVDADTRRWKRILAGTVDIGAFGVKGDGTADDTDAWNLAIAALNAGEIKGLHIPAGLDILLDEPDAIITCNEGAIFTDGMNMARLTMKSSSTVATFFQIGDASNKVNEFTIFGLGLFHANGANIVSSPSYQIDAYNCARINVLQVYSGDTIASVAYGAPFLKLGNASYNVNQALVANNRVVANPAVGAATVLIQRASGGVFFDNRIGATPAAPHADHKSIKVAPPVGGNIDSLWFGRLVANYDNSYVPGNILEIDFSYDDVGSMWFYQCNFEQSMKPIWIHNDNAATGFVRRVEFTDCRFNPIITTSGSMGVHIDNSNSTAVDLEFNTCLFSRGNGECLVVEGPAADSGLMSVVVNESRFSDRRQGVGGPIANAVKIGASGVTIRNSLWIADNTSSGTDLITNTYIGYAIEFTAAVERFTIEGNDFYAVTKYPAVLATLLDVTHDPRKQVYRNNKCAVNHALWNASTSTAATPVVIKEVPLFDETITLIRAKVLIKQGNTSGRAAYVMEGMFYRDGGGVATAEGSTSKVTFESAAGFDADFNVSGNSVQVRGTAANAVNTYMVADLEIIDLPSPS